MLLLLPILISFLENPLLSKNATLDPTLMVVLDTYQTEEE
jgi:hypothetical protein